MLRYNRRRRGPWAAIIGIATLTATTTLHGWQDVPTAMSPVAIGTPTEGDAANDEAADQPATTAVIEHTPLGAPGSLFGLGDKESDAEPGGMSAMLSGRTGEWVRVTGALAIVIGLLLLLRGVVRRAGRNAMGGGRPSGLIEVLARYPMGRGHSLVVLNWSRRIVLVHQSGATMTTLSEMSDPDEVAALLGRIESGSRKRPAEAFRGLLRRYESEHDAATDAAPPHRGSGEIVDLTRSQGSGLGRLVPRRRAAT